MTKHLLQEKYGGSEKERDNAKNKYLKKNTFFQNYLCCSASLKLNITKLSSEPTIVFQVVPHVVFFVPGIDYFLINTFPDSTQNVNSTPSYFLLDIFPNSQQFQDAQINYTVLSIKCIKKNNKYLLNTYYKQCTYMDTITPSLALYSILIISCIHLLILLIYLTY